MLLACDEAGFTGPDLLAKDQRYFAFASVNISDDDAWALIEAARKVYPVQMPELKASKLMGSNQGRRLISHLVANLDGRFAINAHDKLLRLKFQVQHPQPKGHRMLRWTDDTNTSTARNAA